MMLSDVSGSGRSVSWAGFALEASKDLTDGTGDLRSEEALGDGGVKD
jgi:hypothetical protein